VAAAPVIEPTVDVPTPAPISAAPAAVPPAPVVRPPVVVEPLPDIKPLLSGVADLLGVTLTALIDREGALMEAAGSLLPEAMLAGALAACLVESTDGVGRALAQGQLQSVILEYDGGVVLLNAVGPGAMLAVVLDDPAVLGKVRYHVKKALPDLVRAV
jgi:predicted regulator of Ras-like GTPase activity (Roadblock/LC7/MglB family)